MNSATPPGTPLPATVAQIYKESPAYVRWMQRLRLRICPFDELMSFVPQGAQVFDIGCGAGLFVLALVATGRTLDVVGVDANESIIGHARAAARQLQRRIAQSIHVAFAVAKRANDWPTAYFPVVSLIDVIHHIPAEQQEQFFKAAARRVAPGGILIYKDMVRRPQWRAWANRLHDLLMARQWINYAPLSKVRVWGLEMKFAPIAEASINRLVYGHEYLIFRATELPSDS